MREVVADGGGEDRGSILEVGICICQCVLALLLEGAGSFFGRYRGNALTCLGVAVSFDFYSAEPDPRK